VIVQTQAAGRDTPDDIEKIFVRGRNDTMIPLASLVTVREAVSPRELNHFNQRRSVSITANLAPDYSLGEALDFMDATAAKLLKPGYTTDLNGVAASSAIVRARWAGVRAGAAVHLPGAGGAVRELCRSAS
jgi:multidrug efflux pump